MNEQEPVNTEQSSGLEPRLSNGLLVVGGGPAGHSAAMAYRKAGGAGPVWLLCAETRRPYNRPPLTKDYLRGESEEADLPLASASDYATQDIQVYLGARIVGIDPVEHVVTLEDGDRLPYASCVWATGSRPAALPVPGADHPDVLRLRSLDDGRRLRSAAREARTAIVIGSGFIGCEAAASLAVCGIDVTMISAEAAPQMDRLGADAAGRITGWLSELGVHLVLGSSVGSIEGGRRVRVTDGGKHEAELIVQASGVKPCTEALDSAVVTLESDRVVVDEHMRSSLADLYAAGDVALAHNLAARRSLPVEHWGEALTMGEIAGTSAAGGEASWDTVPGFWTQINDHTLKYAAWGDGFDHARFVDHGQGAFTIWYTVGHATVGVLTHEADEDYQHGSELIRAAEPPPRA